MPEQHECPECGCSGTIIDLDWVRGVDPLPQVKPIAKCSNCLCEWVPTTTKEAPHA